MRSQQLALGMGLMVATGASMEDSIITGLLVGVPGLIAVIVIVFWWLGRKFGDE